MFLHCYGKFYSLHILLCYVNWQLASWQRQLGKRAVMKAGAYIVSIDRKATVDRLKAGEIVCFEKHVTSSLWQRILIVH